MLGMHAAVLAPAVSSVMCVKAHPTTRPNIVKKVGGEGGQERRSFGRMPKLALGQGTLIRSAKYSRQGNLDEMAWPT